PSVAFGRSEIAISSGIRFRSISSRLGGGSPCAPLVATFLAACILFSSVSISPYRLPALLSRWDPLIPTRQIPRRPPTSDALGYDARACRAVHAPSGARLPNWRPGAL